MLTKHNNIKRILAVILAVLALVGGLYGICRAYPYTHIYQLYPLDQLSSFVSLLPPEFLQDYRNLS